MLKELPREALNALEDAFEVVDFGPGERVYTKGDYAASLYVLKRGTVFVKHAGIQTEIRDLTFPSAAASGDIFLLGLGDTFGEEALLSAEPTGYAETVTASSAGGVHRVDCKC